MLNVGLTGGIGAGKSSVSAALSERGAIVVDSDRIAREVVEPGRPALAEIVEAFGSEVLDADGRLDRPRLGSIVFADDEARQRLNAIVHPRVRERSAELVADAPADGVVVHDIPLLAENGLDAGFPLVLVVYADAEMRVRRLLASREMSETDIRARMSSQASDEQRAAVADVVLDNSGDEEQLGRAVDRLWRRRLSVFADNLTARRPAAPLGIRPTTADRERAARRVRAAIGAVRGNGAALARVDDEVNAWGDDRAGLLAALAGAGWFPVGAVGDELRSADPGSGVRLQLRSPADPSGGPAAQDAQIRKEL